MSGYNIDFSYLLPNKSKISMLSIPQNEKGPLKPKHITYMKDEKGRLYGIMDKPQTINIGGHKFKNVLDYVVTNFADAATDNGKLFDITTPESDITAYTHDGKFAFYREHYNQPRKIKIGEHELKNAIYKTETASGAKEFQEVTKYYRIRTIKVSPDGTIIGPKKNLFEKAASLLSKKSKTIGKLLKNFK